MATYVIGDIQGCYEPFQRLLEKIRFDPAADQLWITGDLVNRGGQSLEVLRLVYSLRSNVISVLGNHDLHLLGTVNRRPWKEIKIAEFKQILKAPDHPELLKWLAECPVLHRDKSTRTILVHAGLLPGWTIPDARIHAAEIELALAGKKRKFLRNMYGDTPDTWRDGLKYWDRIKLATNIFTRIRICNANSKLNFSAKGPPEKAPRGYLPWYAHPSARKKKWTIVFGHWAALGLMVRKRIICLDSGCVWGGKLTAMRLEDREIFQVDGPPG
jgi:bis(5'-nucleosyl)-tetraphosphatase (symmetrical)